ncbi:MAG: DUF6883 domain-containing protein, partial [Aquisalimonadaceae bacterium]
RAATARPPAATNPAGHASGGARRPQARADQHPQADQEGVEGAGQGQNVVPNSSLNATKASVDDKLVRYLLNPDHPVGGLKARWFESALGFTRNNADDLAKQIVFNERSAIQTAVTPHGTKYNQVISITGANGKIIDVNFGWIRNADGIVRLVTGIPTKK